MIGSTILHYNVLEKLGEGGMGVVYLAEDTKLGRKVALKFLPQHISADSEVKARFEIEARAAAALNHPNIATIYSIEESGDQMFISMENIKGVNLKDKISSAPEEMDKEEAIKIVTQIADGLEAAHKEGITHRDIKTSNIMITESGIVKIMDFGLAKIKGGAKVTKIGTTVGTIAYISPEQVQGKEATHQSDIWSLGVVMYEMLTGQLPFKGDYDQVLIYSILDKEPERITSLNPEVPVELENIVNRALEKDIRSRYQNIQEMLTDLISFKNKMTSSVTSQTIVHKKKVKKWLKPLAVSIIILVSILSVIYFTRLFWWGEDSDNVSVNIAVIGFENQTGDSTYNYLQKAIPSLLITDLEQSKHLHVMTWERMSDLVKQFDKNKVGIKDKDLSFRICRLEGIDAIVLGSFVKAGNVFATDIKVLDVRSKQLIKSANTKGDGLGSILENQIDYLSNEIINGIVPEAREIESVKLRIADVSTTSLKAYNELLKGREEFAKEQFYKAIDHFESAINYDSTFALAYLQLGIAQYFIIETRKANESFSLAEKYKAHTTDRERIYIESQYSWFYQRDTEKSIDILEKGLKSYPKEKNMHLWLGHHYVNVEKYANALNQFNEVLKLDPGYGLPYKYIGWTYANMGKYEKALDYMNKYVSTYPQYSDSYVSLSWIYLRMGKIDKAIDQLIKVSKIDDNSSIGLICQLFALKEDYSEALKWEDKIINMRKSPSLKDATIWWRNFQLYFSGQINKASDDLDKMLGKPDQIEAQWIARAYWLKGWIYYKRGKYEQSKKYFNSFFDNSWVSQFQSPFLTTLKCFYFGITDFKMGKIDSARNYLDQMKSISSKVDPEFTNNVSSYHNLLYGMVLMKEDSLNKAEEILKARPAVNIPPTRFSSWAMIFLYIDPLPQDDLARVYIRKGDLDKAIDVYQKLTSSDMKIRGFHLIHPKYHYRLGKLYELKGWNDKAILEYEKFLRIYKDADKDLPEYIDAKKRLENLKSG